MELLSEKKASKPDRHSLEKYALSQYKILIVDDTPDITITLKLALEKNGFERVDTFNDPLIALSSFKGGYYDLTLIDLKMPNMNGFELYQEIRKKDENVRTCFITAYEIYYETLKKDFPSLNVGCFISKPVKIDKLIERIKEELEIDNSH